MASRVAITYPHNEDHREQFDTFAYSSGAALQAGVHESDVGSGPQYRQQQRFSLPTWDLAHNYDAQSSPLVERGHQPTGQSILPTPTDSRSTPAHVMVSFERAAEEHSQYRPPSSDLAAGQSYSAPQQSAPPPRSLFLPPISDWLPGEGGKVDAVSVTNADGGPARRSELHDYGLEGRPIPMAYGDVFASRSNKHDSSSASPYARPTAAEHASGSRSTVVGTGERGQAAIKPAPTSLRKTKASFVCPVPGCGSAFTRQFNLKGHMRSHSEERPYVCKWSKCGKGFARQHDCKRHEALHLNIRPFTCEGCGKAFARMDALNRHLMSEENTACRPASGNASDKPVGITFGGTAGLGGEERQNKFMTLPIQPSLALAIQNPSSSTINSGSGFLMDSEREASNIEFSESLVEPALPFSEIYRILHLVDPNRGPSRFVSATHPVQLWEWLADVALNCRQSRDRALRLQGEDAARLSSFIHACLADSTDATTHGSILRLLQDICSMSEQLPTSYWLTDITVNYQECIGRGGEALVYMGTHKGSSVVVRKVSLSGRKAWTTPLGQSTLALIRKEIVTHSQLRHENIIPLLGVFRDSDDGPPVMILPFMENGPAPDYLDTCLNTDITAATIRIVRGVARALCYLHTRNPPIVHGDLHPGNILVNSSGDAVLCDFGFSRIRHEITRTHTTIREGGRGRFMAPELSLGADTFRTSPASDVYSLAMTFLALFTRQPPFAEYPREAGAMRAAERGLRPQRPNSLLLPSSAADALWSLLERMWAPQPAGRPDAHQVDSQVGSLFHDDS